MGVNKAILLGRLGRDPELKYTPGGKAVATFSLATTERWTTQDGQKKENTTWHNIVAWGKPAEIMKEYLRKGSEVFIEGRIDNRSWDDKDGNKRYISEVVVSNFQFVGSRAAGTGGGEETAAPNRPDDDIPAAGGTRSDDDLPF